MAAYIFDSLLKPAFTTSLSVLHSVYGTAAVASLVLVTFAAAKSGIPFQQTTLLDILNKKSSFSGLLNGVNASADATAVSGLTI